MTTKKWMGCAMAAGSLLWAGVAAAQPAEVDHHPNMFTIGIGAGYDLPAELDAPNTVSVRFRLPTGLTFEPFVDLSTTGTDVEMGGADVENGAATIELGTNARIPLFRGNRADFILIGGGALTLDIDDPDGDNNDTKAFAFALNWGIAVDFWITQHWAFSFNALNPLFALSRVSEEEPVGDDTTTTNVAVGAIFEPDISFMIHLFF